MLNIGRAARRRPFSQYRQGFGSSRAVRLVAALVCTVLVSCAANPPVLPALDGDYFRLESHAVGRPFHIYVRLPQNYADNPQKRYPVVYLLDGDSLFPILASNHLFLNFDDKLPEAIVVGIAYGSFEHPTNRRGYDYSWPAPDARDHQGGAGAFHKFLATELVPAIEEDYRADPARRILFGQSRGGHFVLYSAFTQPDFFWGRIASNPVLYPGRDTLFGTPARASRNDLVLVVTSGTNDRPEYRNDALAFFDHWADRSDTPWSLALVHIDGGTHAANSTDSYRIGMRRIFALPSP